MREKVLKVLIIFILVITYIYVVSYAGTQWYTLAILNIWSVDSGKHLDWGGSTSYLSNFNSGVNKWNNYKNGVIRQDTINTIQDITISDTNYIANNVNARTTQTTTGGGPSNTIVFSTYYMESLSDNTKTLVCTHELGHALGLDENNTSTSNVMYSDTFYNSSGGILSADDKYNYDYMYFYYY